MMDFNEIFWENVTCDDDKLTKKQNFSLSSDGIFFEIYS